MMPRTDPASERIDGLVVRRIDKKGFAFIQAADGQEFFVHISDCVGDETWNRIEEGSRVTFVPTMTQKGARAAFVKLK
jgi:cold shock CspA family protein